MAEVTAPPAPPSDAAARRAITERLDQTLFVEAGAGSGKTRSLVDRVLALVVSGVRLRSIAAITFTEKAAAELRDRIRRDLETAAADPDRPDAERQRCADALGELDGAAISTLHAFAQRLLSEHPIEAGLPPSVEVLDEISSQIEFDDRWVDFVDRLLDSDALARPFLLADTVGLGIDQLRDVATSFGDNWDLVAERVSLDEADPPVVDVGPLVAHIREVVDLARYCHDPDNTLLVRLDQLRQVADELEATDDEIDRLRILWSAYPTKGNRGAKTGWPDPDCPIDRVRDEVAALNKRRTDLCSRVGQAAVRRLAAEVARFTLDEAQRRRESGRLEFHDLLVLARRLLRDPVVGADVRVAARGRYQRLLLDEFQDTDPIQIELAVLLASPSVSVDEAWADVDTEPGRLFFVGDPKQSIYRFRRADIRLFLAAAQRFGPPLQLSDNFRSARPIVEWVNGVFGQLIRPEPDSQPAYEPLAATQGAPDRGPGVAVVGQTPHDRLAAGPLRDAEAGSVVAAVRTAVLDGWSVSDGDGGSRPARLGDICILLPARTSLPQLERALEREHIPYRAETSSLVYATREVRDLLAVLRAVDDPTDELSLVTALRSAAFGCGDDDLYTYRVDHRGVWSHQADLPESLPADHPVADAMRWLADVHDDRHWLTPSAIVDRVVRERRLMELAFAHGRPRDLWRRLRFVTDQARAYGEATGGSLRDFLSWVRLQTAEGARVTETVLPESDDDSVRIMTVHASKGLEFPIAVVSGTTTRPTSRRRGVQVVFPPGEDGYGIRVHANLVTDEFERFAPIDEQMDSHEKLRLLYVACTRARDHLVVSCHRLDRAVDTKPAAKLTAAELLWQATSHLVDDELEPVPGELPLPPPGAGVELPDRTAWAGELDRLLAEGRRPRVTSATAIARVAAETIPGIEKEPRDLELPPWNKGRYGTAIGRAVHGVLQSVELGDAGHVSAVAESQAVAEGVAGHAEIVEALARSALGAPVVGRAATRAHWKEVYVGAPVADHLVEGYVDLLFRDDDGLVVVDYKTDAVAEDGLDAKVARYRLQAATYAIAVEAATGERVARAVFVFCRPDGALERDVHDLDAARAEVEGVVRAGVGLGPAEIE